MRRLFFIGGLLIIAYLTYLNQNLWLPQLEQKFSFSYCDQPIRYKIGQIDPKFNLSQDQFLGDTRQASQLWNDAYNKPLFVYDSEKGNLIISMVFDGRQSIKTNIDQQENQLTNRQSSLQQQIADYEKQSSDFKQKVDALNHEIEDWNSKGGAPPDVYAQLIGRQNDLKIQAKSLNQTAVSLNQSTDLYNSRINNLNQTINTFNDTLSVKPEEGLFRSNPYSIEIYFNVSQTELQHTLAHEFGHALGLPHNNNQKSIMYPSTTLNLKLSSDDLIALQYACRQHSYVEILQNYLNQVRSFYLR